MAGGATTPELVSIVSNCGCLGSIGAGYLTPEALIAQINEVTNRTNKPYQVNLFIPNQPAITIEDQIIEKLKTISSFLEIDFKSDFSLSDNFHECIDIILDKKSAYF